MTGGPGAQIVLPLPGKAVVDETGFRVPAAGASQLVLPRAVGAFACGNTRNLGDRRVIVGTHLFYPDGDIDAADGAVRTLELDGSRMRGAYTFSDASRGQPVRHDYTVRLNLRRQALQ